MCLHCGRRPPRPPLLHAAQVNSLTSFETELPFDYYTMPFCKPVEGVHRVANSANPGTILQGLRIENSPYTFTMKVGVRTGGKQPGTLQCYQGNHAVLPGEPCSVASGTMQCYQGNLAVLPGGPCSVTRGTMQCYQGDHAHEPQF